MIKKIISKCWLRIKDPVENAIYRFLMRGSKYLWGRKPFGPEELKLLNQALVSQNLFGVDGKMVNTFKKEFALLYGIPYAVASTSGTAAIHTALGTSTLDIDPAGTIIVHCIERNRSFYKPD